MLILDDSSSALDFKTDALLRGALAQLDSTKIIIAQRISSVRDADRIAVLVEGELRDCGTHEELLSRCAEYLELYRSQTKE